jgi:hypothetical protein
MTHRKQVSRKGLKDIELNPKKMTKLGSHSKNVPSFGIEQKSERNITNRDAYPNKRIASSIVDQALRRNSAYKNVEENEIKFFEGTSE